MSDRLQMLTALAQKTNKSLHWYGVGMEQRGQGAFDAALQTFADVRARDPDYVPAYFMAAQVCEEQGDGEAAAALLEQGIETASRTGDAHALAEMQSMLDTLVL